MGALSPADARYRALEVARLEVRELALRFQQRGVPLAGAVGRFTPWSVPGAGPLDGGQLALLLFDDRVELGTYGGLVPTATLMAPRFDVVTAGGYAALEGAVGDVGLGYRGRLGITGALAGSARADAESQLRVDAFGWFRAHFAARGGVGLDALLVRGRCRRTGRARRLPPTRDVLRRPPRTPWRM